MSAMGEPEEAVEQQVLHEVPPQAEEPPKPKRPKSGGAPKGGTRRPFIKWFAEYLPTNVPLTIEGVTAILAENGHVCGQHDVGGALSLMLRSKKNPGIVRVATGIYEYRPIDGTTRPAKAGKAVERVKAEAVHVQEQEVDEDFGPSTHLVKQIGFDLKARPLLANEAGGLFVATPFKP